jgi:3-dehydroquinate synthase
LPSLDCEVHYFPIPDGEAGKSFSSLSQIWNWLGSTGFTRSDLLVGIGGGTVTDLTGFAAATWLRGIDWVAIPTTIAGGVDAAVGGKTGINSDFGKNLIGAFHSPCTVIIDPLWFSTLSDRDFAAGLAEVIKCGFIAQPDILQLLKEKNLQGIKSDMPLLLRLIELSVETKAKVVGSDFKENFEREVLNYGHTLGHAIEKHSKFALRHGEAISIGLVFAAELSKICLSLSDENVAQHRTLLSGIGLPITYPRSAWPELRSLMGIDKKARGNTLRFVGLTQIGKTQRIEGPSEADLEAAYEKVCS